MTVFALEMRRGKLALIIWSLAIAALLAVSILIYPEMASQMSEMNSMFSEMGAFTEAFGMDKVNFGEFNGYFAVECGNVLCLGGAMFAAVLGISALSKEQKDRTADYLLTHPVSRTRVAAEKLLAVCAQVLILNVIVAAAAMLAAVAVGERPEIKTFFLLFSAFFIMQIELAAICFGLSAFMRSSAIGAGIGLALALYSLNIISNITSSTEFLKYVTPFSYADASRILTDGRLEIKYIVVGAALALASLAAGFIKFRKKDL